MSRALPLPPRDPAIAAFLAAIRGECNRLTRLDRDPLALVRPYAAVEDREVAGLAAAVLAFGRVDLIMAAVEAALRPLGRRPARALDAMSEGDMEEAWGGFQYRYCFSRDLIALFRAVKKARAEEGSLEGLFAAGDRDEEGAEGSRGLVEALGRFARRLNDLAAERGAGLRKGLVPEPERGSACKRLFLFLRWMVRRDQVDPGGWSRVGASRLVVPIDTHMARICSERLGFIPSAAPTLANALRATECFRLYAPEDPVGFDFALTRPGIDPAPGDEVWGCS